MRALGTLGDAALVDYMQEQLQIGEVVGHSVTVLTPVQEHQPSVQPKTESRNDALCARLGAATLGLGPDTGRQAHDGYPEGTE